LITKEWVLSKYFLPFLIIAVVTVLFILIIAVIRRIGSSKTTVVVKKKRKNVSGNIKKKQYTIEQMVEIAARRDSSKEDLKRAIDIVAKELPFPKKIKYKVPKISKVYLNFVLLIASHRNADAKLIAYMDKELKKTNPEYSTEIDIYENEGFRQRRNRI